MDNPLYANRLGLDPEQDQIVSVYRHPNAGSKLIPYRKSGRTFGNVPALLL
jgi:hypothetical protein